MRRRTLPSPLDRLTFEVREHAAGGGIVAMMWETTEVSAPFTVVQ